jgi:F-type H+-transporting ATPase subunit b
VITWFTIVAQIVNFLILVFLLWKFLYKPILKTMDDRQKKLENRWEDAQRDRDKARESAAAYRQKRREIEDRRSQIMAQAKEQAEARRKELIEQARHEVDNLQAQWRSAIDREQKSFLHRLRQQVAQETYDLTRRTLQEVANTDLEERAIARFCDRLQRLEDEQRDRLREALQASEEPIFIRSGFPIPDDKRHQLLDLLQNQIASGKTLTIAEEPEEKERENNGHKAEDFAEDTETQIPVKFVTSERLLCGITVQVDGQAVSWDFQTYLQGIEERFAQFIQEETRKEKADIEERERDAKKAENIESQVLEKTYAIARRALQDLADADLEERAISVFLKRLQNLNSSERKAIDQALGHSEKIAIRSSFEIPQPKREQIIHHLKQEHLLNHHQVQFAQSDDLICGVELQFGNRSIVWSLERYMDSLERRLSAAVKEEENAK